MTTLWRMWLLREHHLHPGTQKNCFFLDGVIIRILYWVINITEIRVLGGFWYMGLKSACACTIEAVDIHLCPGINSYSSFSFHSFTLHFKNTCHMEIINCHSCSQKITSIGVKSLQAGVVNLNHYEMF